MTKLSIIIVSWNVRALLQKCLASIYRETKTALEVIVVDNASTDGSADLVANEYPQVKLIRNTKNLGFARANNQGLRLARGEYVIFLNDDTEIRSSALDTMVDFLDRHQEAGIIGARLLNADGSLQRGTARQFPTAKILATMLLGWHSFLLNKPWLRKYYLLDEKFERDTEVDQVMGASLMTRLALLKRLGSFCEEFWIWFEEVDLCQRYRAAGHKIFVVSAAEITHHQGKSFVQVFKLKKFAQLSRSLLIYSRKHLYFYQFILLALLWPLGFITALAVQLLGLKPKKLS